ncbi:TetR/AcrR family transcriptional regulator [Enterococcus devriesei]|uniref:TetR/AcrR family transcriptional regulator n=1 Tax=Enterococcus devriesei TaxID=319970 RepID=UPI0028EA2E31|nr:TetR/AcrR family transcriptional regulator [Enterococcus devriesei]
MGDLRFERTDEMLQIYFMKLLAEMPFEQISVSKLAKASKIDRTTFYAHYENTYQLAEQLIDQHIDFIERVLKESSAQQQYDSRFDSYDYFNTELMSYLLKNRLEIQHLRQLNFGLNSFNVKLRDLFATAYSRIFHLAKEEFSQYILTTLAMSNFDFILEKQRVPSKKEIKEGLSKMASYFS